MNATTGKVENKLFSSALGNVNVVEMTKIPSSLCYT